MPRIFTGGGPAVTEARLDLVTETRVICTDDDARRRFSRYWWLIGRFSALIPPRDATEHQRDAEAAKVG